MASRRTPDSILEPPGLDFEGSGPRFWPILKNSGTNFSAKSWLESFSYQQVRISWFRLKLMTVFHLACQQHETNCSQNVGFHFPMGLRRCSPADARLKCMAITQRSCTQMGRRRWPPLEGVQSAAHRRCAGRARLELHRCQPKLQIYHK